MRLIVRLVTPVLVSFFLVLTSGFFQSVGRGEPAAPAPASSKRVASASARADAERAIAAISQRNAVTAEAVAATREAAWAAAQRRAVAAQAGKVDERTVVELPIRVIKYAPPEPEPLPPGPPGTVHVPILMYHHIADPPPGADAVRRDLSVRPDAFASQMQYLRTNGYKAISLQDLANHLRDGAPLPPRPVLLTFDDGYADGYTQAYPILHRYGFTGAFFIITDAVGHPEYMSWEQIIEMSQRGMDIEAHGRTHGDLAISSPAVVTWEVSGSRSILEEKIGRPVRFYCYPSGRYTAQTIEILKAQGFEGAVTIDYGVTQKVSAPFELQRLRIRGGDTLQQFIEKLTMEP